MEEEAWNAYPYTKTIYRCPFIEKFVLEIETVYHDDDGSQENVFNLSEDDLSARVVGMSRIIDLLFNNLCRFYATVDILFLLFSVR